MRFHFRTFAPPRHPLAKAGLALLGIAILGVLSAVGLALAAVVVGVLGGRAVWRRIAGGAQRPAHRHDPQVLEGEYTVVRASRSLTAR